MEQTSPELIILRYVSRTAISKAPLSDHCFIALVLEPTMKEVRNKGYWKFNARLLQNEEYCNKIRELIKENENNESIENNMGKREYIKFKIRQFTIKFCKELNRKKENMKVIYSRK